MGTHVTKDCNFLDTVRTTLCCPDKFYIYQSILKNIRENIKVGFWNISFCQISDVLAAKSSPSGAVAASTGVVGAILKNKLRYFMKPKCLIFISK